MRQGLPLTQKASENSNKSSPPSPPCVRRKEMGFPDVQLYQVTTCERPPCSLQRGHSPIMWVLMGSPPHPTWPLPPRPTRPWWEARPVALPDSFLPAGPALHGCHGNPSLCQWGLLFPHHHLSLGPEPLQGGPGSYQTEGRFPEAQQGPGPRPGIDSC